MSAPAVLRIALHRRIWRVTLDGAFYGDYRSEQHAAESAAAAAESLRKAGRAAQVVAESKSTMSARGAAIRTEPT